MRSSRAEIVGARRRRWPWWGGIGWRAWGGTVGLIGAAGEIVEVQLRSPRWAWLAVLPWRYTRIAVSMQDPEALLEALQGEQPQGVARSAPPG